MSTDFLAMSDEDFLNQAVPSDEVVEESGSEVEDTEASPDGEVIDSAEPEQTDEPEETQEESDEIESTDEDTTDEAQESGEETEDDEEGEADEAEEESDSTGSEDLSRILQPFRANGKDVQVKNVDEAITLMQMGANFTKKMQALQPNLKMLKTLEKNDLLDEGKLNYLIDLSRKDPKAIAQLVKDAEFDPLSMEEDTEYTPTDHQVSAESLLLTETLESIESTPTYSRCIDLVGNQWDEASKELLTKTPQHIADINEQMQMGIFDIINDEVERVKMFGGLKGLSDFEAYRQVGAQLYQAGKLTPPKPEPVATTPKAKPQDKLRANKRKAAATPKPARKVTKQAEINPLAMSDEDFLKINNLNV